MPIGAGVSGGLSSSDFRSPFVDNEGSSNVAPFGGIAPGSYGVGAKILFILTGRSGFATATPKQNFTFTMSGGPLIVTPASPYAVNGSKPTTFSDDPNNYVVFAWIIEPDGWSFDSGSTTFTITYQKATAYVLTGTVSVTTPTLPGAVMTGSGTKFTTELEILSGARSLWLEGFNSTLLGGSFPGFYANITAVTDDTHCSVSAMADAPTVTNGKLTATISANLAFNWRMLTFTNPPPAGAGVTTAALYGSTTGTAPLYANGTTTWSTTTSTGEFGLLADANGALFNTYLADTSITEAYAVMQCIAQTGPAFDVINLSGTGNWSASGTQGTSGLGSSGHALHGFARWTRFATLDTTYSWSNFPASTFGHGFFIVFPTYSVGVGHSFAVIIA
jgi:hypothetical protein